MKNRKAQLKEFFDQYAAIFNSSIKGQPDIEGAAKSFSGCFIGANPSGTSCGSNDEQLRAAISRGYSFYKRIGVTAMDIVSCDPTILDDFHEMTKIRWRCSFTRKDGFRGNIVFENIYFTQTIKDGPKIFCYITGDEQAVLKENGLI
jgi:hypothetical protein